MKTACENWIVACIIACGESKNWGLKIGVAFFICTFNIQWLSQIIAVPNLTTNLIILKMKSDDTSSTEVLWMSYKRHKMTSEKQMWRAALDMAPWQLPLTEVRTSPNCNHT